MKADELRKITEDARLSIKALSRESLIKYLTEAAKQGRDSCTVGLNCQTQTRYGTCESVNEDDLTYLEANGYEVILNREYPEPHRFYEVSW